MDATQQTRGTRDADLLDFEGLVIKTSSRYVDILKGMEFEDICQVLRLKVWKSLEAWDPTNPKTQAKIRAGHTEKKLLEGYVYGNVKNAVKDLLKMNKKSPLLIEDIAPSGLSRMDSYRRDRFEERYMSIDPDHVFQEIEDADPLIPSTLSENERQVLACLYLGYDGPETAERLGIERRKVATARRNIKRKMADWKPSLAERISELEESVDLVTV